MSDNKNKSPLEEAKEKYEEITKFAQEQAAEALEEKVAETLKEFFNKKLNEDTTINIDSTGNVEIKTDGEVVDLENGSNGVDLDSEDNSIENIDTDPSDDEEFEVSDDEDEIAIGEAEWLPEMSNEIKTPMEEKIEQENMEEINKMMEDNVAPATTPAQAPEGEVETQAAPVTNPEAASAETAEKPSATIDDLLPKLDTVINLMMQQMGGETDKAPEANVAPNAEAGTEQEFEVIDDEAQSAAPATPAPAPAPAAPTMEEEIEIEDFEDNNFIDEMEEEMLEIEGIDDEDKVDEVRGVGFTALKTGQRQMAADNMKSNKGHHAPVGINENKAHDESKLDELIKENNSLKKEIDSLKKERKNFESAFSKLRTQFNEMQLFNGKLVLVNKVLTNGGLTKEEKLKVCEQFDSAKTHEEAAKIYKNIMKENNIKVESNGMERLKAAGTNTAKPKSTSEPLYESAEARRNRQLAGIDKLEEN